MENVKIDVFLDKLIYYNPTCDNFSDLEKEFRCKVSFEIEKHNSLQYTYFYEIDFGFEQNYFVEIESGINNGTQLNHSDWGFDTKSKTKTVSVLKDIVVDKSKCTNSLQYEKAKAILSREKAYLFEYHRQNNYDNYVTGGNSKMKLKSELLNELTELLEYQYEEKEVDCNFV